MALVPGSLLGAYEIVGLIGAGGMGEVYRATDTNLKRQVAIKVLPASVAADAERLARFQREAEVLAALNDSNIAAIYGLERSDGSATALVLELVEGPTLADRIAQGAVPLNEALPVAKQIAKALEAAHEKGIIHRDLKPANIKVRPDGTVKILDFGLAKALDPTPSAASSPANSPTLSMQATQAGLIIGTAAYMSPEQAAGKPVDKRTDLWAFGVVLMEMLTGRPVFEGETVSHVLALVLTKDPDRTSLPANTPASIHRLLRRCLEKDPKRRLDSATVARLELDEGQVEASITEVPARRMLGTTSLAWSVAAASILTAVLAVSATMYRSRYQTVASAAETRLQIVTPPVADLMADLTSLAIAPDGRKVAFSARGQLWLRPLETEAAQPLPGTENGIYPFWSPDSRSIGFFAEGQLKRVDFSNGVVRALADAPFGSGGTWSQEDVIVFAPAATGTLYRIPAAGGALEEVTKLEPQQTNHRFPVFLGDGRHFVFFAQGAPENQGLYVAALGSMTTQHLSDANSKAVFVPPDYLMFSREGALFEQRIDLSTLKLYGDPLPVAPEVALEVGTQASVALSASNAGTVVYRSSAGKRQLVWMDRSGKQVGNVGGSDAAQPSGIRLSPDGHLAAFYRIVKGNPDVWLIETARGVLRRLTIDPARDWDPIWSPDGRRIVFESGRTGVLNLYERAVDGTEPERLLLESPEHKTTQDWSPDGRFILYSNLSPKTARDLWALPLFGNHTPFPVVQTAFEDGNGRFSPDGRWLAYESTESGPHEVYIQPFPGPGSKVQISTNGGGFPQWRRDGRELFYLGLDDRLMAVPLTIHGSSVETATAVALFSLPVGSEYAASSDGQRFLVNMMTSEPSPITVFLNRMPGWTR